MWKRMWQPMVALTFMATAAYAGPITLVDTLGPTNSYTTSSPYTVQTGVSAFAFQFTVAQTTHH